MTTRRAQATSSTTGSARQSPNQEPPGSASIRGEEASSSRTRRLSDAPILLVWTLRLLAGTCFFGAWLYVTYAIRTQSPDDYWLGIALAGEAMGLLRRLQWARIFGLLGLALLGAWSFWEQTRTGATVGGTLTLGVTLLAGFLLARHPRHFQRRWW